MVCMNLKMGSQWAEEIRTILYVEVENSIVCGSVHVKSTHQIDTPPPIFLKFGTYIVHLKLFNHKKNWSPNLYGFVVTLAQTLHFHYSRVCYKAQHNFFCDHFSGKQFILFLILVLNDTRGN